MPEPTTTRVSKLAADLLSYADTLEAVPDKLQERAPDGRVVHPATRFAYGTIARTMREAAGLVALTGQEPAQPWPERVEAAWWEAVERFGITTEPAKAMLDDQEVILFLVERLAPEAP